METIEMDLMQAQIAELTTEVTRLQNNVIKNDNVVTNAYQNITLNALSAIQAAITEILTDQTTYAVDTETINSVAEEMFLEFKKAATAIYNGNSVTIIIPIEGDHYTAFKICNAYMQENTISMDFTIPVYTIQSPVTAAFNIQLRFTIVHSVNYDASVTAWVHKLS